MQNVNPFFAIFFLLLSNLSHATTVDHTLVQTAASSCYDGCKGWQGPWDSSSALDSNPGSAWSSSLQWAPTSEWIAYWFNGFHPVDYVRVTPRIYDGRAYGFPESVNVYYSANGGWNFLKTEWLPANAPASGHVIQVPRVFANGILLTTDRPRPGNWGEYHVQFAEVSAGINDCSEFDPADVGAYQWCWNVPGYFNNRTSDTAYLNNRAVKVGINKSYGGAIMELYRFQEGRVENLTYEHGGGAVQVSMYGYEPGGAHVDTALASGVCNGGINLGVNAPFNPIQAQGISCSWDSPTNDIDLQHIDPSVVHVEMRGFTGDFAKGAPFTGFNIAQAVRLGPAYAELNYHVWYDGPFYLSVHPQELPAVFTARGMNHTYYYYSGNQPYTHQPVQAQGPIREQIYKRLPGRENYPPQHTPFENLTENWVTTCDRTQSRCMTVATYAPDTVEFSLGHPKGSTDDDGGYLSPTGNFAIYPGMDKHFTTYVFPYRYDEVVEGKSVRQWIYDLRP